MQYVHIGSQEISRFILGSNPFSGFSHQGSERDREMKHYFSTEHIKATLRDAERLGITTLIGRTDHHVMRVLLEYWDEGGKIQWFAQTCPEVGNHEACITRAASGGAKACHIHGGVMDYMLAQNKMDDVAGVVAMIRKHGLLAGIAGHNPKVFEWAEANVKVDYYMCSYYNSAHRDEKAEHVSGTTEWFLEDDRRIMSELIPKLTKPVIHYKILAAGRNDPQEAFDFAAKCLRPTDAVCVGVYPRDKASMLADDVKMFLASLTAAKR